MHTLYMYCSPYAFSCSLPVHAPPHSPPHTTSLNPHAHRLRRFVSLFPRCTLVMPEQSSVRWDNPRPFHLHSISVWEWNGVRDILGQRWQNAVFKDMFVVRWKRRKEKKWSSCIRSNPGPLTEAIGALLTNQLQQPSVSYLVHETLGCCSWLVCSHIGTMTECRRRVVH